MASILSNNQSQDTMAPENQAGQVNNFISKIINSSNPQKVFNDVLSSSKDAQNAMSLINQYGNGDPKTAFMNYIAATSQQSIGQQIMQKLGLK